MSNNTHTMQIVAWTLCRMVRQSSNPKTFTVLPEHIEVLAPGAAQKRLTRAADHMSRDIAGYGFITTQQVKNALRHAGLL
jgi:hypothetical protein